MVIWRIALGAWCGLLLITLVGCVDVGADGRPQHAVHADLRVIDGKQRLFSSIGFWFFDDDIKTRLSNAYKADGAINREVVVRNMSPYEVTIDERYYVIKFYGRRPEYAILGDGGMISIDPKYDDVIKATVAQYDQAKGRPAGLIVPHL